MKQKIYFMLVAAAALFTACSSNDLSESPTTAPQLDDSAVNFSAYVNRGVTRAGAAGTLTTNGDGSTVSLQTEGFGVFSYYSDSESFSETSKPNFMYNQQVTCPDGVNWIYSPLKYWPNEFGKNASSEGQDRLTFFAYAPWVNVNPSTGRVIKRAGDGDNGIVGMTSNTASGDPYIKYYADMDPDNRVDLCWGVAKQPFNASVDEEAINLVDEGWPYIDVIKPTTGAKIDFNFKHALAAVNVQIDTDVDVQGHNDNSPAVDKFTRIWVRSVTFEGFTDKARLNLNSNVDPNNEDSGPQWFDLTNDSPVASGTVTIYDGRTDGKEGRENATAKKETPAALNAKIVQSAPYVKEALEDATNPQLFVNEDVPGVTKTAVNLFAADDVADDATNLVMPIYVIPTGENLKVTIVYDVETYDNNLATFLSDGAVKGSSVQNTIEQEIKFVDGANTVTTLEAGKHYIINLHLGLTSVKFDASVTDWVDDATFNVDLPYNSDVFTADEAAAYNETLDGAVHAGDPVTDENGDPVLYTAETAAAYNATLPGAVQAGDVKTPAQAEVLYTDETAAEYNATLPGAVSTETVKTPATEAQPAVYSFNAYMDADPTTLYAGTVKVISQTETTTTVEVVTNEVEAFVGHKYVVNAVDLTGGNSFALLDENGDPTGISVQDVTLVSEAVPAQPAVYYTEAEAIAYNAQLDGAVAAGDVQTPAQAEVLYTDETAAEYNATLDGAVAVGDPVLYTQEEADAYNANLPGAVSAGDLKPQN